MLLRSGLFYNEFPAIDIDFDYASHCWRLNKMKVIGYDGIWLGMFRYR